MSALAAFSGEVQLLRWSDTSTNGATITLQLSDACDLERFKNMTLAKGKQVGQRLAAVMVEIGDDEQPVAQVEQPKEEKIKKKSGQFCIMANTFYVDKKFQEWVSIETSERCCTPAQAKKYICDMCGVTSSKDLDESEKAADLFLRWVRNPFLAWKETAQ